MNISFPIFRGISLDQIIGILEDDNADETFGQANITLLPPENANENITDEDSSDKDELNLSNLPASQFRAQGELQTVNPALLYQIYAIIYYVQIFFLQLKRPMLIQILKIIFLLRIYYLIKTENLPLDQWRYFSNIVNLDQ